MCSSSALATACGIGGGTIYCAFLLGIQHFQPSTGFPISNFLILTCGCASYITAAKDKYIHPNNSFVDYDLAVIFSPSMLLGTKFGTIFNKTFSSLLLTIFLIILMCYSMNSTYKNMVKAQNREKKMDEDRRKEMFLNNNDDVPQETVMQIIDTASSNDFSNDRSALIQKIKDEDNNPVPIDKIKFMLMLEVVVIIDQIIEGNSKVPSLIGITKCSSIYWLVFIIYCCVSLFFIKMAFDNIKARYAYKKSIDPNTNDDKLKYLEENTVRIVLLTVFAGIVSSMVGIGGGMITNPILLGMGLDPKATSSTSTFLIMTTALASSFIYLISGQLNISYAICMGIPCTLSAYYGSKEILKYINRTHKNSILLSIMLWFLIISMAVILVKTYFELNESGDLNIFKLKPYC